MLEGTSISLSFLQKFNKTMNLTSSFYITFLAHDPAATPSQKTFQVRVDEQEYGRLDLTVSVARPKKKQNEATVTTKRPFIPHFHGGAVADGVFRGELPDWPSNDTLKDNKRFYVLKKSEWQATDWIPLYLELLICSNDRDNLDLAQTEETKEAMEVLSKLQILEVAMETKEEDGKTLNERLNAKSAHVFITFKGLAKSPRLDEIGEHVVRGAIIRRVIYEPTGYLSLLGKFEQRLVTLRIVEKGESSHKRPRLGPS